MSKSKNINTAVNLISVIAFLIFAAIVIGVAIVASTANPNDQLEADKNDLKIEEAFQSEKQGGGAGSQPKLPDLQSNNLEANLQLDFSNRNSDELSFELSDEIEQ